MIFLIGIAATIATFLGGLFAFRFKDRLHLVLGFSAGAVIGVAFFDLLPEALELAAGPYSVATITSIVALGFIAYMLLDRAISLHSHHEEHCENPGHHPAKGALGAGSLSIHSFLDGVAIGLAFKVSAAVGVIVAIAVLVHDFSDGINTINMVIKNGGEKRKAFKWLFADAVAPLIGIISTLFFTLPASALGLILATFCGFFLYIGASDLLPESHHAHSTKWTTFMTVLGVAVLFLAIRIASF
jgi:zinc transporter ZupT